MTSDPTPAPNSLLAEKYRVTRLLGQGGMGVVLEARHEMLATSVAIKVMSAQALQQEGATARFLREARAAAGLKSEYVARVTDFGTLPDGRPFMVMELLVGEDLSVAFKREGLSRLEWIDAILQVCAGLAEAHAAGILHRDLKPANFFRTRRPDGSYCTKILDFGISKLTHPDALVEATTKSSVLLGTPYYMSPEQVRSSREIDARSDIWQIGVVLYQAMTGCLPFDGDNVGMLFARILEIAPRPASELAPDLPEPIDRAISACLEKDAALRPATIGQLAAWLEDFGSAEGKLAAQRARSMQPGVTSSLPSAKPSAQSGRTPGPARSEWTDAPVSRSSPSLSSSRGVTAAVVAGSIALGLAAFGLYALVRTRQPDPVGDEPAATTTDRAPRTSSTGEQAPPPPWVTPSASTSAGAASVASESSAAPSAPPSSDPSATGSSPRKPALRPRTPAPPTHPPPPERPTLN